MYSSWEKVRHVLTNNIYSLPLLQQLCGLIWNITLLIKDYSFTYTLQTTNSISPAVIRNEHTQTNHAWWERNYAQAIPSGTCWEITRPPIIVAQWTLCMPSIFIKLTSRHLLNHNVQFYITSSLAPSSFILKCKKITIYFTMADE